MAIERTFSIIKPDAVGKGVIGGVVALLEKAELRVIAMKTVWMTKAQAEGFYAVHRERKFFPDLVAFMTRGPCVVQVLEGESAVAKNREVMGATDSKKAAAGTIRAQYGTDIEQNAVHGSDSPDNASIEINFFFSGAELAALSR